MSFKLKALQTGLSLYKSKTFYNQFQKTSDVQNFYTVCVKVKMLAAVLIILNVY